VDGCWSVTTGAGVAGEVIAFALGDTFFFGVASCGVLSCTALGDGTAGDFVASAFFAAGFFSTGDFFSTTGFFSRATVEAFSGALFLLP